MNRRIAMTDAKMKNERVETVPEVSRQWISPALTVLVAGATAGGPVVNTEAYNYRPS